jgi:hypothetical protein
LQNVIHTGVNCQEKSAKEDKIKMTMAIKPASEADLQGVDNLS